MISSNPVLLNLDFATKDIHADDDIRAALEEPDRTARMVRATTFGAPVAPTGSPKDWEGAADAVFRVAHRVELEARHQGRTPRVIVTGRAGLPLFVQLGMELSGRVLDFTLLNRRLHEPLWDRLDFGPNAVPSNASSTPFFEVCEGFDVSQATGRVAVTVSTSAPRAEGAARAFLEKLGEPIAGEVTIRTHRLSPGGSLVKLLDRSTAAQAGAELLEKFNLLTMTYPNAKGLAVFVDGPATLAFLTGRAIVPRRNHATFWVPSFERGEYHDALRLPHRPKVDVFVVHDRADSGFVDRLDQKPVSSRWRLTHVGKIPAGESLEVVSRRLVDAAEIVLVLVSPSLLANKDAWALVERALDERAKKGTRVIPILARQCGLRGAPRLAELKGLPSGDRWLERPDNDALWAEVDEQIDLAVEEVGKELFGEG